MNRFSVKACPVCRLQSGNYFIPIDDFQIYKCGNCGLEYTNPVPTEEELQVFYTNYRDFRADETVLIKNGERNFAFLKNFGLDGDCNILDFGAGKGSFVNVAGRNCFGVEVNGSSHERVFPICEALPHRQFDLITMWGVLEHLAHPFQTIHQLTHLLANKGKIALTTVWTEGDIPYYYKPVEHLTYWTKKSINFLLCQNNMKIVFNEPYVMLQKKEVYLNRLLSRTPKDYQNYFEPIVSHLPDFLEIPTNEILVIAEKI